MLKRRVWNLSQVLRCFLFIGVTNSYSQAIQVPHQLDSSLEIQHSSQNLLNNVTEQLYSPWTSWSDCSRECDVGITTRTRKCLKRSYNSRGASVPACRGDSIEHKICKLKNCPPGTPDILSTQCTEYNNRKIAGKLVTQWVPAKIGSNPCELRCVSLDDGFEYSFGKVVDGTPCTLGVCLDGRCLRSGCDQRLGSEVEPDMCGVCGGHNASCVHYKDLYVGQPSASDDGPRGSYHEVVVIPVSARHLFIRQPIGKNILALQDRSKGVIFQGDSFLSSSRGSYGIAGTVVDFIRLDNSTEALVAKEPVTQELYVLALLRSHNAGIYYEYWLPKETNNPPRFYHKQTANPRTHATTLPPFQKAKSYTVSFYKPQPTVPPHHHHPTKPHFAYPYDEKPYRAEDVPVFRHRHTTTHKPHFRRFYDANSKRWYYPDAVVSDGPVAKTNHDEGQKPVVKTDLLPAYRMRYLTRKPLHGYYQTFRNHSSEEKKPVKVLVKESPELTQGDSSSNSNNGRYGNSYSNVVFDYSAKKDKKSKVIIEESSDLEKAKVYNPNPKWKYTVDNKDQVLGNSSEPDLQLVTPLTIAVLPLPEMSSTVIPKRVKKKDENHKTRLTRGGMCEPCQRVRDQAKHFCKSDFVIRASVISVDFIHGETRYELEVKQSFKNNLSLLAREYVWAPDTCRCPKLRPGKEYVIMGRSDNSYRKNESRLLVDKNCFVRAYNLKYARRLQKLRKDQAKKCKNS